MVQPPWVVLVRYLPFPIGTEKAGSCHAFWSRRHLLGCRWRGGCSLACSGVQTQLPRMREGPIGAASTHGIRVVGGAWCAFSCRAWRPGRSFFHRSHPCSDPSSTFLVSVVSSQGFNSLSATLSTPLEFVSALSLDLVNSLLAPPLDLRLALPLDVVVSSLDFPRAATRPRRSGAMSLVTAPCEAAGTAG